MAAFITPPLGHLFHLSVPFLAGKRRDARDLQAVTIEVCDVQNGLQFIHTVSADVGVRAVRREQAVAFLPDPDGVGFHTGELLEVADLETAAERTFRHASSRPR